MSDQQLLEWIQSEVDQMEEIVAAVEDGETDVEEAALMLSSLEYDLRRLRRAVLTA